MLPIPAPVPPLSHLGAALRVVVFLVLAWSTQLASFLVLQIFGLLIAATLGVFAAGSLATALSLRIFERVSLASIGLGAHKAALRHTGLGVALGGAAAVFVVGFPLLIGKANFVAAPAFPLSFGGIFLVSVALLFGALGEELIFRGYPFQLLAGRYGVFQILLPSSVLFAAAHSGNLAASKISLFNTFLWGVLLGYALLRSGDLWLPTGIHFGWNFTLPLFGVNLSGFTMGLTGYTLEWKASDLWSGGAYGPEASVLTLLAAVALFYVLYRLPWQRQKLVLMPENDPEKLTRRTALLLVPVIAFAKEKKLSNDDRMALLRGLTAEYAKAKVLIPRSKKPLPFEAKGTWDKETWEKANLEFGPAARPGEMVQITKVDIKEDRIELELNNGLKTGRKWYDHVEVGMGNRTTPVSGSEAVAKAGSNLVLLFGKNIETIDVAECKKLLAPLLDFEMRSVTESYMEKLPEPIRKAIEQKKIIEGMDRDQARLAAGQPARKERKTVDGDETEDWVYGRAPGKITFVTFTGAKVSKVRDMYAGLGGSTATELPVQ